MSRLNMEGSFLFTSEDIDKQVTRKSPGNYALSYSNDGTFSVNYVGRSDTDLNRRLKEHLGSGYKRFKYSYASTPEEAFDKECRNYHDFTPRDNGNHPDRPRGATWRCPQCSIFG